MQNLTTIKKSIKKYDEIPMPVLAIDDKNNVFYTNEETKQQAEPQRIAVQMSDLSSKYVSVEVDEKEYILKKIETYESTKKTVHLYMILTGDDLDVVVELSKKHKKEKKFFQDVLDCIYDQIYVIDNTGKVLMINEAVLKKDYHREKVVGKTMKELIEIGFSSDALCYDIIESKTAKGKVFKEEQDYDLLSWGVPHFDEDGNVDFIVNTEWDFENLSYLKYLIVGDQKEKSTLHPELEYYRSRVAVTDEIIGKSAETRKLLQMASKLARSDATILIYGESGTGKELLTKYIYNNSPRANGPLIEVNCGAIPENLVESELFGYEKGAFTDADTRGKKGLFEAANRGTILLDEISEIPFNAQAKLLRTLQEKEIHRIGGNVALPVDVRVIAATNINLKRAVEEKKFREDLFYRLNVLPIYISPLRERVEDIPELINHFISQLNAKYKTNKSINSNDLDLLCNYDWPGNVRELRNIVERALLVSTEDVVPRSVWVNLLMQNDASGGEYSLDEAIDLKESVDEFEKNLLLKYMPMYETSRQFAELMNSDKSTINRKLKKHGINR